MGGWAKFKRYAWPTWPSCGCYLDAVTGVQLCMRHDGSPKIGFRGERMIAVKKQIEVEAVEFMEVNGMYICDWSEGKIVQSPVREPTEENPTGEYLQIETLEGTMTAIIGDWIIKGVNGEFYPCKPDIFEATYDTERWA